MIQLDKTPTNFQLDVTSSSCNASLSFCLDPVYDPTRYTPLQLAFVRDVTHTVSRRCNYI